jgi:cytochrome c oxidase subunit 2
MSIHQPPRDWFKAPSSGERIWIGLALAWCVVLFAMMPYWHYKGKQNSTGESYRVKPAEFQARVDRFVAAHTVGSENYIPVVEPPPGGDAYLIARTWQFFPILKLRKGQTYRLHISSPDLQHGFSLQPLNMNFQVIPGYDHVLTITPTTAGQFTVICNEYCGLGHQQMTGKIIVE